MENVSVIIPVYNAEHYIAACIESLLHQTSPPKEIILIDDGSTDKSRQICAEFASKNSMIQVFHISNGGAARARNEGLNRATGEFIVFIDADDYIPANHIQVLTETQKKYEADLVCASVSYIPGPTVRHAECVCSTESFIEKILYRDGVGDFPVSKLYRRTMFESLRFTEGITSEDFEIFYRLYKKAQTIAITDKTTYYYQLHNTSVSNSGFSEKFFNRIDICEQLLLQVSCDFPQILPAAQSRVVEEAIWLYGIMPSKGYEVQKQWVAQVIKKHGEFVKDNPKTSARVKKRVSIFLLSPKIWVVRTKLKNFLIAFFSICNNTN